MVPPLTAVSGRIRAYIPHRTTRYVMYASAALTLLYLVLGSSRASLAHASTVVAAHLPSAPPLAPTPSLKPVRYPPDYDALAGNPTATSTSASYSPSPSPSPSAADTPVAAPLAPAAAPVYNVSLHDLTAAPENDAPKPPPADDPRRANATLLMLARNSELETAAQSVRELEDKFNREFRYPWVFLNEVPFSEQFKQTMRDLVSGEVHFGQIPMQHWWQPDWVDVSKAEHGRRKMVEQDIIYAGSQSYRNMCRFNSGFFYRHPLLQKYRWYWRVEPDVHFHCIVDEDPFLFMEDNDKHYGFTITLLEFEETIKTLWQTTKEFMLDYPEHVAPNNSMSFLSNDGGETYNLCHFWSNFEIADMDFWRGPAYSAYFDYLDARGGFYYERWGDAPVHSIAAGLFLRKEQVHFFDEIGYEHNPFTHCPHGPGVAKAKKCTCRGWRSFDYQGFSCLRQWERIFK